jgi:hypothetical protein
MAKNGSPSNVVRRETRLRVTLLFALIGYLGVCVSYSHLIGFRWQTSALCPLCPYVDGFGEPMLKFLLRVAGLGTINALLWIAFGWFGMAPRKIFR